MSWDHITEGDFGQELKISGLPSTGDFTAFTAVDWLIEKAGAALVTLAVAFKAGTSNRTTAHTPTDGTFFSVPGHYRIWVVWKDGTARKLTTPHPQEFDVAPEPT